MRKIYFLLTLMLFGQLFAQIPTGYYNTATGTGYTLKTQLHNIIDNQNVQTYNALWTVYTRPGFRDSWYENDGTLLDIYSENPNGADAYEFGGTGDQCGNYSAEGDCYNREHLIPQSVFSSQTPMYTDAFHIWPTDGKVNGERGNYPFGKVGTANYTSSNGSKKGNNLNSGYSAGYSGVVFEPIDEFKGDVARAYFYFATRYEGDGVASWTYDMFNHTNDQVFTVAFKNILLYWNAMDPVSPKEVAMNNTIYSNFQGNRNPYIDHPEWITEIWGETLGIDNEEYQPQNVLEIYPTYSNNGKVYVKGLNSNIIEKVLVFEMNGKLVQTIDNSAKKSIVELNIPNSGIYIVKSLGKGFEINRKVIVK